MQVNHFFSPGRLITLLIFIASLMIYVVVSYGRLAFKEVPAPVAPAPETERGSILDRNGKPLAVDTTFYHLAATPSAIGERVAETAKLLAPALNMDAGTVESMIRNSRSNFLYLKKKINEKDHDALVKIIKSNNLRGLRFDSIPGRIYPENSLASQVIGYMGDDGKGLSGIEYSMQDILSPDETVMDEAVKKPLLRGKNVYLTLDANLQYKLEKVARDAMQNTGAESLMLIAAEAKTGEILSYVSLPAANLNAYGISSSQERIDRPAVHAYEPGSVFKLFSVASFIESGSITQQDTFICDGIHEIRGRGGEKAVITCLGKHGKLTAREALQYSCNDALAQMSERIDSELFLNYLHAFGFGTKTGIELPGETRGSVKTTSDKLWSLRSKPTISIGQEISVSALQMVQATTALANAGVPAQLTLISKIVTPEGSVEFEHKPVYKQRVLSPNTAEYLLSCMQTTARAGTGTRANIKDVSIGVKTGTAQMLDPKTGRYSTTDFISNCMAVFPIENPEIILYIVISKAKGETYAGRIVAPVIGDAADIIIDHLGLARKNAASITHPGSISFYTGKPAEINDYVPDFTGVPKKLLLNLMEKQDLKVIISGNGYVVSQNPPPGTKFTENMTIELFLE